MVRINQIYGILEPIPMVHKRHVVFPHHNEPMRTVCVCACARVCAIKESILRLVFWGIILKEKGVKMKIYLNISRQWEITSLWMPFKTIIS